jgi:Tol biopolymer transport system component
VPRDPQKVHGRLGLIRLRSAALVSVAVMLVLVVGCGNDNQPYNDTPSIISLFPSSATAGGPGFTLNISGNGFISTAVVYWNNAAQTTTFNTTSTQLSISVTAQQIATAGTAQVVVVSPLPGGGASTAVNFTITAPQNPLPTISSLSPANTAVGVLPPGNLLTVNGTNFISSSSVSFNGIQRTTNFVSATQLTVPMTASDVASNATINVTVSNPAPGGGVSGSALFQVGTGGALHRKAGAAAGTPFPQVVSVSAAGGPANGGSSAPAVSSDGRFVAFYSTATNLVPQGASGSIFVRDTCLGASNCSPGTFAVDLSPDGSAPNAAAESQVAISADGRFVAFASSATNLLAGITQSNPSQPPSQSLSQPNVYVRDLCLGIDAPASCVPHTDLVSVAVTGDPAAGASTSPSLSADGRFVGFLSTAPNLVAGGVSGNAVYVRDTCAGATSAPGCVAHTYAASASLETQPLAQKLADPIISASGRYVVFDASVSSAGEQSASQVFLADACLGLDAPAECIPSTLRISLSADGSPLAGLNSAPSISADGRFVAFESVSSGDAPNVFLRDTCLSATGSNCVPSTTLLIQDATAPYVSANGRYVSAILAPSSGSGSLLVYDTCFAAVSPCSPQPYAVAVSTLASAPSPLTSDGSFVAFVTSASASGLLISNSGDALLTVTPF